MSETFKELLVEKTDRKKDKVLGGAMVCLAAISLLAGILVTPLFLIGVAVFGILSYVYYFSKMVLEYEYMYMDKEIMIDRITNQTRRKKMERIDLGKMEMLAPIKSFHLDSLRNQNRNEKDYSTGAADTDELKTYVLYYSGKEKYILSLNEEFASRVRTVYPNKVFLD